MSHLKILPNGRTVDEFCQACGMWKQCKSPRMEGEGSSHPVWMFVGEAPGKTEDEENIPWSGEAGSILRQAVEDIGIPIGKCRFSNVVKCRPEDNDLSKFPNAINYCRPHILREIHVCQPKVVVLLGNSAIQSILHRKGILKLHGQVFDTGLPWKFVICFHPAYLLRNDTPIQRKSFRSALLTAKHLVQKSSKHERKRECIIIRDKKMLQEQTDILLKQAADQPIITDLEGSTITPFTKSQHRPEIGCVGFALDDYTAVIYPGRGRVGMEGHIRVSYEDVMEEGVRPVYEASRLVGHFEKYGYVMLAGLEDIWAGGKDSLSQLEHTGFYADTGLMSYTLNELAGGHSLDEWSFRVGMPNHKLPMEQWKRDNPQNDPERGGNLIYSPANILYPYCADDCIADYRLFHKLKKKLKEQKLWERPFKFPIMWLWWLSAMMEIEGVKLDLKRNLELRETFTSKIQKLDDQIRQFKEAKQLRKRLEMKLLRKLHERVTGYKRPVDDVKKKVFELYRAELDKLEQKGKDILNINPDTKRELVYDIMDYPVITETIKSKKPSTDHDTLVELNQKRPSELLTALIERGEYESSNNKYVKPVAPKWECLDGFTHTIFKPQGTRTGRPSSENPNHLNLPKRYELAKMLRSQFIAKGPDWLLLEADEKQMELRLMADRANDETMIDEFNAGKDPHRMGAAAAYEIPEEEVTKEQRSTCKNAVSFGLVYGRSAEALAADFGWPLEKGEEFKARYFGKYHGIAAYLELERRRILKNGLVISHFNRHRRLPEVQSDREGTRNQAVREGINAPIQGDGSDIASTAGYRLAKWLFHKGMKSRVCIFVYDAVYVSVFRPELERVIRKLTQYMRDRDFIEQMTGWRCQVPFDVDISIGTNLGKMSELEHKGEGFVIPKEFLN